MKNSNKIIIALLAMMGVACTTDLENEVAGVAGVTTLSVDIAAPETKIALGDKTDDKYPVYWSEGDRISINGYTSEEASINPSNPRSASFTVPKVLDYPFNILYPASESQRVSFVASQEYVEGSFDSAATPMYGRATASGNVAMANLCGVLRFNFAGAVTLASMTVTAAEGALAGDYAIDCATGALSDGANLSNAVEYSFGGGLKLDESLAKPFYLALPAGEYGVCSIVLRTTGSQTMRLRFNTTAANSIKAGVVKEFQPITFKAGGDCELSYLTVEEGDLIIDDSNVMTMPELTADGWALIDDRSDVRWLANNSLDIDGVQYKKVRLTKNVDCRYMYISSLNLFEGTEFDGGDFKLANIQLAKGSTGLFGDVAGMTVHNVTFEMIDAAPYMTLPTGVLFGSLKGSATLRDVTLRSCCATAPYRVGAVAGALYEGEYNFENVTVDGGTVATSYETGVSGAAGAFVGYVGGEEGGKAVSLTARFTNCRATAEVAAHMEAADRPSARMIGVVEGYTAGEKLYFTNCDASGVTLTAQDGASPFVSRYTEEHRAGFSKLLEERNSGFIGKELYHRAEVYFEGDRFAPTWDGTTKTTMLTEVKDGITRYLVYSPYDLATAQGAKLSATKALVFKTDVDMGGHAFKPLEYVINLDGENHSLYNLKVDVVHNAASNYGAAFIRYANNATTHKDLTFVGADINCTHDATMPMPAYGDTDDNGEGNAYAGVLVSRSWRTAIKDDAGNTTGYTDYIVSNVHVRDSKVRGVCKVGGLIGACRGQVYMDNCSVDNSTIENYDPKVVNYYSMKKTIDASFMGTYVVEGLQWWYTAGECGGLIGFLHAHYAEITNCSVTNSRINCTGQPNKEVVANVWNSKNFVEGAYASGQSITMSATTTIAGRHVNQFIGDLRSSRTESQAEKGTGEYTNKILNYTVSGNTYNGVPAESTNDYNHNYASGKYCDVVGCAYYTGVDLTILIVSTHVSECAGTLVFSAKGGAETTLTEAVGKGSNMDWFGGDGKTRSGNSYYPEAPAN